MSHETTQRLPNEPEAFTARWHAYELGRLAFRDNQAFVCPFAQSAFYRHLSSSWFDGYRAERDALKQWQGERDAQRQAVPADSPLPL